MPKTEEEIAQERAKAQEQLESILSTSRPKNLGEGLATGVNNIVGGAVGAAGIAVLAPTMGLALGLRGGGILGGTYRSTWTLGSTFMWALFGWCPSKSYLIHYM